MLRVYQLLAPAGRLRLWIGCRFLSRAGGRRPTVHVNGRVQALHRLDGQGLELDTPTIALADGRVERPLPDLATGVYECDSSFRWQDELHVEVGLGSAGDSVEAHVLPNSLDETGPGILSLLVASCYHGSEALHPDLRRTAEEAWRASRGENRPSRIDMVVLLGDQVYLDLPLLRDFPDDRVALMRQFAEQYVVNWFGDRERDGLQSVMKRGPVVFLGDDHELWNNAPFPCAWVGNSLSEGGRQNWRAAAASLYRAFQAGGSWSGPPEALDPDTGVYRWRTLDVPPFSFLFCDGIWQRTTNRMLDANTTAGLTAWVERLNREKWHGVFCSGVSMLQARAKVRAKAFAVDAVPADFPDHAETMGILARTEMPLLLLGGDFHYGRMCRAAGSLYLGDVIEMLSSPLALVRSPWDVATRIRGLWSDWPRHFDANFDLGGVPGRSSPIPRREGEQERLQKKGDHLSLLRLAKTAGRPSIAARWFGLRDDVPSPAIELYPGFGETRSW